MAATRRSFFGFLFGAAAAVPALPEIVEAALAAKVPVVIGPAEIMPVMPGHISYVRTSLPLLYRGVLIQEIDSFPPES